MPNCAVCHRTTRGGTRCARHEAGSPRALRATAAWKRQAKQIVDEWVAHYGWWCPGWGREPHTVLPGPRTLHADHPVPLAAGGSLLDQEPAVLCASCNGRKADRHL